MALFLLVLLDISLMAATPPLLLLLLSLFDFELVPKLVLYFVLCISEQFSKGLLDFVLSHLAQITLSEIFGVLDEVSHLGHHEARYLVAVEPVPVEQAHDLDLSLLAHCYHKEIVLIWSLLAALLRQKFNLLVRKQLAIFRIEVF